MQDQVLLRKAKNGNLKAFEALLQRYQSRIYAHALRMTENEQDAFDVSQNVALKIYKALPSFREEARLSTWIYQVTRNACLDFLKKRRPQTSLEELAEQGIELPAAETYSVEKSSLLAEKKMAVKRAICALPASQKSILILRDIEGYSYEENAILTKTTLGTVKSRISRARGMIRQALGEFGGDDE